MHIDSIDIPLSESISDESLRLIKSTLTEVKFNKGHLLIDETKLEMNAYIIKKGTIRSFIRKAEKEITFWFAQEGDIINSSFGYLYNKKGYENYQLLEDCILYKIDIAKMKALYATNLEICNWSRTITELEAMKLEKRYLDYILLTPEERYLDILENKPDLFQRVALKEIASFIGVSPVSLSRIRARI